jgi:hypothetical protein
MKLPRSFIFLFFIGLFLFPNLHLAFSQGKEIARYQFVSPKPGSVGINPETVIVIRYGIPIDINTLKNEFLEVSGEMSGKHSGSLTLNSDNLTLIYKPDKSFAINEKVRLNLIQGIKTGEGQFLPVFSYGFTIRQKSCGNFNPDSSVYLKTPPDYYSNSDILKGRKGDIISFSDIPEPLIYCSKGASQGNIMTVLEKPPVDYLYLFNNNGTLLLARKMPHRVTNFKPHYSGVVTYFDHVLKGHIVLDSFLNPVDTLYMKNGYLADAHDVLLLENGHVIMESYDPQQLDMSKVTEGGDPNATVIGLVIQELDENRDLIFEWRSWDHFRITDSYNNLLASIVEYVHGNSLDADSDTTLIFSSRNMNEITKISRSTGKILWRLGGKNNEFDFSNDPRRFSAQHSVMRQKNGNLTLFDNGNGSEPLYSRGIEYEIDEDKRTVSLKNEYRHNPDVFAYVTGNLQRLENGSTFIFWGSIVGQIGHAITEYDPAGGMTFEAKFDLSTYPTYASYRTKWDHTIFRLSNDSVRFSEVILGDSVSNTVSVNNLTDKTIIITSAYTHSRGFTVKDLPISIPPAGTKMLTVGFRPLSTGSSSDIITICQETDSSIIARQLVVSGESIFRTGIKEEELSCFEIYPNPVGKRLEIRSLKMISRIIIYDLYGRNIKTLTNPGNSFAIDMESEKEGFYIIVAIFSDKTTLVRKIFKH